MKVTFNRPVTVEELKEIMLHAMIQETSDKRTGETVRINGDYADIDVVFDEDGNMTVE